jgi:5-oxoprolinase (ATP-hydrolysing)
VLYEEVIEVHERVVLSQEKCEIRKENIKCVTGRTGEDVEIWQDVDEDQLRDDLKKILQKGIRSISVILMHSYM